MHQFPIQFCPVFPVAAVLYLHTYLLKVLLISRLCHLCHYLLAVDILLQREENLVGVDGFDEIVSYLRPYGLVHDVFLFALGYHHHRHCRHQVLDALQGFQSAQSGHHLIEQHEVKLVLLHLFYGIGTVAHGDDFVTFLFEKHQVGLEQFYLVVSP